MYVIMGATGNIGSRVASRLLERGEKVKVVGRSAEKLQPFVEQGAEIAVGDASDTEFLTNAFKGAKAVFAMIPPNYTVENFRAYQNTIGASIAAAIQNSGVKYVVNLSSQGADLPDKTGPIAGLHDQEQRLNGLTNVNVVHLRAAYFMENLFMNIDMIKNMGMNGSAIKGEMKFPMIATQDIANAVVEYLLHTNFTGKSVRDLLGERDVSLQEATTIIGEKISKPDLKYVRFSYEDVRKTLIQAGLTEDISHSFVEMSQAFNDTLISSPPRNSENTTETSIEAFAEIFAQIYNRS